MSAKEMQSLEEFFVSLTEPWFEEEHPDGFETRTKTGIFSFALTVWLMISQRLHDRRTTASALKALAVGEGVAIQQRNSKNNRGRKNISLNTGGFCRARKRLQLERVEAVSEYLVQRLRSREKNNGLWRNKRVYIFDGTLIELDRQPEILTQYGRARNQNGLNKHPLLRCLCAHELTTGIALSPAYGAYRGENSCSELELGKEALVKLPESALIVGDRNFGIFSFAHYATVRGHEVLLRLTSTRAKCLLGKNPREAGLEENVIWKASKATLRDHPDIPAGAKVGGRFIHAKIEMKGFRPLELFLFTTSNEPAEALVELYARREQLENDIRAIKHVLRLEMISSKTPEMIAKELLLGFAAYNLVRACIANAASRLNILPRKISFTRAIDVIEIYGHKFRKAFTKEEQDKIAGDYYTAMNQIKLPNRTKKRSEPRKLVRKFVKTYPSMKFSREVERDMLRQAPDEGK